MRDASARSFPWFAVVTLVVFAVASCSSPSSGGSGSVFLRTETREGAPCGDWYDGPTHMVVQCGAGLFCLDAGTLTEGSEVAMCVRTAQPGCSTCASGLPCADFEDTDVCLMPCKTSTDCVGPFEVCTQAGCTFVDCSADVSCPTGTRCEGQICERGPPG